ncbi:MAG: hypothetical protein WC718_19050 [Phycisphaerales bacterium]
MEPYFSGNGVTIYCADVREWAREYDGPLLHSLLSDPPYELSFMGAKWDGTGIAFQPDTWAALAKVAPTKPNGKGQNLFENATA